MQESDRELYRRLVEGPMPAGGFILPHSLDEIVASMHKMSPYREQKLVNLYRCAILAALTGEYEQVNDRMSKLG